MNIFWPVLYVDDVICGANEEDEAWQLYCEFKRMLGQGGFNLRKYQTNGVNRESTNGESRGSIESNGDEDESYARATLGTSHSGWRLTGAEGIGGKMEH